MIKSISIKNFKNIGEQGIKLDNLKDVNYLVGPNNSGKSSILSALLAYDQYEYAGQFCKENRSVVFYDEVDSYPADNLHHRRSGEFLGSCLITHENLVINPTDRTFNSNKFQWSRLAEIVPENNQYYEFISNILTLLESIGAKEFAGLGFKVEEQRNVGTVGVPSFYLSFNGDKIDPSFLSDGLRQLISLLRYIEQFNYDNNNPPKNVVFCIDEPELHLNPGLQKLFPSLIDCQLEKIKDKFESIYVFISTHSPFIISAATKEHNVYFIENGQTIDFRGIHGSKRVGEFDGYIAGSKGCKSKSAISIASKMLGAGINDLLTTAQLIHKTNKVIFCESESSNTSDMDETIYNKIFQDYVDNGKSVLFVSCGDCNEVIKNANIMNELSLRTTTEYIGVVDRDGNNDELFEDIQNIKALSGATIESYLYDPEIIEKLGLDLFDKDGYSNEFRQSNVFAENKSHANSNKLKQHIYVKYKYTISNNLELAQLITSDTKVYAEIEKDIFG